LKILTLARYLYVIIFLSCGLVPIISGEKSPYLSGAFFLILSFTSLGFFIYILYTGIVPEIRNTSSSYIHTKRFRKEEHPIKYLFFLTFFLFGFIISGFVGYAIIRSAA